MISNPFLKLLKDLTEDDVKNRHRNAQTLLKRLRSITNEPRNQRLKALGWTFVGGMVSGSIIMTPLLEKVDFEKLSQDLSMYVLKASPLTCSFQMRGRLKME